MLTLTEAALIRRVRETLEALWDCDAGECREGHPCERCATLSELDDLLAQQ